MACVGALSVGTVVKVDGTFANGVLVARKVEADDEAILIRSAAAGSVPGRAATVTTESLAEIAARLRVAQRILGLHQELVELRGALRFCPGCKSYCDEHDQWRPIETLLEPSMQQALQSRVCPECQAMLARTGSHRPKITAARAMNPRPAVMESVNWCWSSAR